MRPQKIKVFINSGYHVESSQSNKYHTFWIQKYDNKSNPYSFALYRLGKHDPENPNGYMVSIPAMMHDIAYSKCWKIVDAPRYSYYSEIKFSCRLATRKLIWFFIVLFMKKRLEREKLMRLSGIIQKEDTLYHKWSPEQLTSTRYTQDNKSTDLYDEMFFQ